MTADNDEKYSQLDTVLQLYGADHSRWPDGERELLLNFACHNNEAEQLLKSYQALDDCLDFGAEVVTPLEVNALMANIMDRVEETPQLAKNETVKEEGVYDEFKKAHRADKPFTYQLLKLFVQNNRVSHVRLAQFSLFAASLVLGLFMGSMLTSSAFLEEGIKVAFLDNGIVLEQSFEDILLGVDAL